VADDTGLLLLIDDTPSAQRFFARIARVVSSILPTAEVEHVGATAVAGCLTKGDVDVLVRVMREDFPSAMGTLDATLQRSERNDPTGEYVEYDFDSAGCYGSIQLAVAGSWHDRRFRRLKSVLASDDAALARYNELKRHHEGLSMTDYRIAKATFIDALLVDSTFRNDNRGSSVVPGTHQ
jgi:GrpB-like predicted nucleotidyltransferase (UPF0157 family)